MQDKALEKPFNLGLRVMSALFLPAKQLGLWFPKTCLGSSEHALASNHKLKQQTPMSAQAKCFFFFFVPVDLQQRSSQVEHLLKQKVSSLLSWCWHTFKMKKKNSYVLWETMILRSSLFSDNKGKCLVYYHIQYPLITSKAISSQIKPLRFKESASLSVNNVLKILTFTNI